MHMIVTCTNCDTEFSKSSTEVKRSKTGNHFCSSSCSAKYDNTYRSRKDRRPDIKCINCLNTVKSSHNTQKYCSVSCQHDYKWKGIVKDIEKGDKSFSNQILKKYLLLKDDSCSVCGITEWNNSRITLELDHINGDGTNNNMDNLRLLCPNCHSQTDTYKAKNTGNPLGKELRSLRYSKKLKTC